MVTVLVAVDDCVVVAVLPRVDVADDDAVVEPVVLSVEVTVDVAEEDAVLVCVDKVHMKS